MHMAFETSCVQVYIMMCMCVLPRYAASVCQKATENTTTEQEMHEHSFCG